MTAHNVALNWQTTVDVEGEYASGEGTYPGQAQLAGDGQRGFLATMNHRVDMPNPTFANAEFIINTYMGQVTFLVPNTHGWPNELWDYDIGDVSYAAMTAQRQAAVAAGYPKANMALVMACYSDVDLAAALNGTPEFASFGTRDVLWSHCYVDSAPEVASNVRPLLPASEIYKKAVELMRDGFFADQVRDEAEAEAGSTVTKVISYNPFNNTGWWIPTDLKHRGDVNQRPKHVYMGGVERQFFNNNNLDNLLWYLVMDDDDLRGE